MDHAFILKCLSDTSLCQKRWLFDTFVDYRKAFDSVWRYAQWVKLEKQNISGKVLQTIMNEYKNLKSCLFSNGKMSTF